MLGKKNAGMFPSGVKIFEARIIDSPPIARIRRVFALHVLARDRYGNGSYLHSTSRSSRGTDIITASRAASSPLLHLVAYVHWWVH